MATKRRCKTFGVSFSEVRARAGGKVNSSMQNKDMAVDFLRTAKSGSCRNWRAICEGLINYRRKQAA